GGGHVVAVAQPQHAISFRELVLIADHGCNGILGAVAGPDPDHVIVQEQGSDIELGGACIALQEQPRLKGVLLVAADGPIISRLHTIVATVLDAHVLQLGLGQLGAGQPQPEGRRLIVEAGAHVATGGVQCGMWYGGVIRYRVNGDPSAIQCTAGHARVYARTERALGAYLEVVGIVEPGDRALLLPQLVVIDRKP